MRERLEALLRREERVVIGLNSGTSMDGIDALAVRLRGSGEAVEIEALAYLEEPWPDALREELLRAPAISLERAVVLDLLVGESLATAALACAARAGLGRSEVDLLASHGQTLFHGGGAGVSAGAGARRTATWQVGSLDVLAERTGWPVVGDFRQADIAAGGQGAPLMPYLDWVLFRERAGCATLNLGGIAALTFVRPRLEECVAHDVGPANVPLDLIAREHPEGRAHGFDPRGRLAARGRVVEDLLAELEEHPFFAARGPKSAGREDFGPAYVRDLRARRPDLGLEDLLATLTRLIARQIAAALDRRSGGGAPIREVVVSGGGLRNVTLMESLARTCPGVRWTPFAAVGPAGVDESAKEALLFALLGHERLGERPTTVPAATGARHSALAGRLVW